MENLKQKIAAEIKKLGAIKHTDSDYKMTKYSYEDIIESVNDLVEKEIKEHSIKLMYYLDDNDVYKNHQDMFLFGKSSQAYSANSILELFENEKTSDNLIGK
jgi:hypothetical protein